MSTFTEADYLRVHQGIVEDMVDACISQWHKPPNPLYARVYRNLASAIEGLRDADKHVENINVWVSAVNDEHANNKPSSVPLKG